MSSRFARRLTLIGTFQNGAMLALIILAGSLFAFGVYVSGIRAEANATLAQLTATLQGTAAAHDARVAAGVAASRYLRSDLVILLLDEDRRVDVYRAHRTDQTPLILVRRRGDSSGDPHAQGALVAPVLGLATAFGLQPLHAHVGGLDVIVKISEAALVHTTTSFLLPIVLILMFAFAIAFVTARVLTAQLVRPLVDVQRALDRFASGDLTPQPIDADLRGDLASLAVAYNGAIAQMERAFEERDRANAAIRQFIADAGHQLRTPLTVIRGFIAILRKGDLRTPQDRERILETMNRQSLVMGSLIEKLMLLDAWERGEEREPAEPIDVAQLVGDVAAPIAEAQPGREVLIDSSPGPLAAIDPSDLAHAITNLLDNALKYTQGLISVRVRAENGTVIAEIADAGPGMTPDEVRHAFDRFYRGSRRDVDGSGLGLPIAKRAIERAGGTLDVQTSPETGSTFTIRLPRAARAFAATAR